jgi:hypothetical protein
MNRISQLFTLFVILILSNLSIQAQTNYSVLENSKDEIRLSFTTSTLETFNVKTDLGYFTRVQMNGYHTSNDIGNPELPEMVQLLEIPICDNVQMQIIPGNFTVYNASDLGVQYPIFPTQPSYSKSHEGPIDLIKNNTTYTTNGFYGALELAKIEKLGIMRNINIAGISVSPVQYNPVTNEIRIYQSIEVRITFVNANLTETNRIKTLYGSPMFTAASSIVINPSEPSLAELNYAPIKMIIVTPPMFETQLASLVEWKRRKGFIVDLALTSNSAVGTTTTSIRNYIKAQYDNATPENPAPTFVLFVGDVAQIPAHNGTAGSHVTDLYYATFTTGDNFPDCYYGRFSATNEAQLAPQLEKTLMYEQYTMPNPAYLDNAVLVAGADNNFGPTHGNGQMNYLANNYVNTAYGFSTVNTHLHPASAQAALIRQEVGAGVGYANYTAHCGSSGWSDPAFETSHIPAMVNEDKYGLMIGNCCQSGKFEEATCFGEALLRASKKGAVGYIGASNNSLWNEDFYWSVGLRSSINANPTYQATNLGAYDRLFHTHNETHDQWMVTNQAICQAGNLAVQASTSSSKLYYWEIYHLFGDPSIMTYLTQAPVMTVSAPQVLMIGTNSMEVTAAPYAYVALVKDGVVLGATFANSTGVANLSFDPLTEPGEYELAAWAQNYRQFFSTVNCIVPSGSYVVASTASVTSGYFPYSNAVVSLDLILSNLGVANATNVYATISTNSPYLTILSDSVYVGSIAQGANSNQSGAMSVQVANYFPNNTPAQVVFTIHSNNNVSNKTINLNLQAPNLIFESATIVELTGNNNGVIDAGETVTITVSNKNDGQGSLYMLTSKLNSFFTGAVIADNDTIVPSITSGETVTTRFTVTLGSSIAAGTIIPLHHSFYKGDFEVNQTIYIVVGSVMEDFETGNFTAYPWVNSSNAWTVVNSNVYAGTYSAKSKTGLANSQTSSLQITLNALSAGNISYQRRVSSEAGYDYFKFYIDNVEKEAISGTSAQWGSASFPVSAGNHVYKFEYSKDNSQIGGSDCAWIDNITFPPTGVVAQEDIARLVVNDHDIVINSIEVSAIPYETTAQITIYITNPSSVTAQNITSRLTSDHSAIQINNGILTLPVPNMLQNDNQSITFPVRSISRNPISSNVNFVFTLLYSGLEVDYPFSAHFEGIPQGINEINEIQCMLFPIPAKDLLNIQTENSISSVEIFDMNGKLLKVLTPNSNNLASINVTSLASGIYFVKVLDENQKIAVKKFVKQ